jgi:hypothetical protein
MSLAQRATLLSLLLNLTLGGCAAEVDAVEPSKTEAAPAPNVEVRMDGFLEEHALPAATRAALLDFAREQREVRTASQDVRRPIDARALRARRRALRERADAILTEMPAGFRAAMHARRLTIYNLAHAVQRSSERS